MKELNNIFYELKHEINDNKNKLNQKINDLHDELRREILNNKKALESKIDSKFNHTNNRVDYIMWLLCFCAFCAYCILFFK
jgi:hypothetical protein